MFREAQPEVREGLGGPLGGMGGVERPTQRSARDREAHPKVREGTGGVPGGLGWVVSPSQRSGKSWEAHPEGWERSESPPRGLGGVGRGFKTVQEVHTEIWEGSGGPHGGMEGHKEVWEGSGDPPRAPAGVGRSTQRFGFSWEGQEKVWERS